MKKFSNRIFILAFIAILILFRYNLLYESFLFLYQYGRLWFFDFRFAFQQLTYETAEAALSPALLLMLAVYFVLSKRRWLKQRANFRSGFAVILTGFFLFAPLIAGYHPQFQKNLAVTKLLPPLSALPVVITGEKSEGLSVKEKYLNLKERVVKQPYNESINFADTIIHSENNVYYFQGNKVFKIPNKAEISNAVFVLGTDHFGRDVFSRIVYGSRVSLIVGGGAVIITFILGFFLGFAAGFPGGIVDTLLNRTADIFLTFPAIFLIILIIALFGNSVFTVIIVLGFSGWMSLFKIVRGEVHSIKRKDFFTAARLSGLSGPELLFREALPVIATPAIVNLIFQFANVVIAEAALSYLGLGTGWSYPSWGTMIESSQGYLSDGWWIFLSPALMLILTLYSTYALGRKINQKIIRKEYDQPAV